MDGLHEHMSMWTNNSEFDAVFHPQLFHGTYIAFKRRFDVPVTLNTAIFSYTERQGPHVILHRCSDKVGVYKIMFYDT